MEKQATSQALGSAPRMRPFNAPVRRPARATPSRLLTASVCVAIVVALLVIVASPEWARALPALLITGASLPL